MNSVDDFAVLFLNSDVINVKSIVLYVIDIKLHRSYIKNAPSVSLLTPHPSELGSLSFCECHLGSVQVQYRACVHLRRATPIR